MRLPSLAPFGILASPRTADAIGFFLDSRRAKGLSSETLNVYGYRLNAFARAFKHLPANPREIEGFLGSGHWSASTRETYFRLLRNLYRWLERREHIRRSPMPHVEAPHVPHKVAKGLSPGELDRLLTHPGHNSGVRALLYLLADTGLRLGEAFSVTSRSVRARTVLVNGKAGEREVPISRDVRGIVLANGPWTWSSSQAAGLAVRRAFKRAAISGPRAGAHALRHTFVRQWKGDESVLIGIMGWTSSRMLKVYRPYDLERAIEQHRAYSPISES